MRPSLLLLQGLRHHARHRLQSALATAGIALGIALWVGVGAALDTAEQAFERAAAALSGRSTHVVRGGEGGVDVAVLGVLAREFGAVAAAPVVTTLARLPGPERRILQVFGCDPLAEPPLRPFAGTRGIDLPLHALLAEPGAFVATAATLQRLGLEVGHGIELRVLGERRAARCAGILAAEAALDDVLVVDIATAQEWRRRPAAVDRIDLRLEPGFVPAGADPDWIATAIAGRLPPDLRLEPAAGRGAFVELTRAFRTNLQALGLLSLLVSAFLVHATMRVAVLARRETFAVLRALGVPARRLFSVVAAEALLLGVLGAVAGVALGILAGRLLLSPVVRTLNDHYATFDLDGIAFAPLSLVAAVVLGALVAVAAALGPAREAAAVPPRELLAHAGRAPRRDGTARRYRFARHWPWPAAALGALACWGAGPRVGVAYAGMSLLLLAAAAAIPRCMQGILALAVRGSRTAFWRYVVRSTAASRPRSGLAVAALALALGTTIGLGMLVASFRTSVHEWLQQVLPADVYVAVPGGVDERTQVVLDPATAAAVRNVPGVAAVSTYRRLRLPLLEGPPVETVAFAPSPRVLAELPFVAGEPAAARATFARGAGILVSEPLCFQRGLALGQELVVPTATGPVALPIVGVFRDYGSAMGVAMVPAVLLGDAVGSLALEAADGVAAAELAERVRAVAGSAAQELAVTTQGELRAASLQVFDRTFAITAALRLFVVLVACLGLYGAFAALQLERGPELGLLAALGAVPRRLAALVFSQTVLLGLCAGLLALPVGIGLGLVMVHVLNRGSFGWTLLEVRLPAAVVLEALGLALLAALLAGVVPALRFRRLPPVAALRQE